MLPRSALRHSVTRLAVRSSCSCTGSVPLKPRLESHSAAMPPTAFVLVTYVDGEVYT
jgi:hypothetical protein